jgi:hypothetical protein
MFAVHDSVCASECKRSHMGLSSRLTAGMVVLVLLTAGTVGFLTYRNIWAIVLPRALDRIDSHARLLAGALEAEVRGARADVQGFASAVAVDGIMRTMRAGGVDPVGAMTLRQWRQGLAGRFAAELAAKPVYRQLRLIGVADGGREIVRVDRSGPAGTVRVVPDGELQQKGDRDYFQRALALRPGEVDVSPVELNQERGAIETPHCRWCRPQPPSSRPTADPSRSPSSRSTSVPRSLASAPLRGRAGRPIW